jgi:hypothetical protein
LEQKPGTVQVMGRGMCSRCYVRAYRAGVLDDLAEVQPTVSFVRYFPDGDTFGHELVRGKLVAKDRTSWTVDVPLVGERVLSREVWNVTVEDDDDAGASVAAVQSLSDVDHAAVAQAIEGVKVRLTYPERIEVVRALAALNWSDTEIGGRLGADKKTVQRLRARACIPAGIDQVQRVAS